MKHKHDFICEWELIQRVTIAVLNIMLTVLYQKYKWSVDGCKQFEDEYTIMCRNARARNKYTLQGLCETQQRIDLHMMINGLDSSVHDRQIKETWRQCLLCGVTVLKQCNGKDALEDMIDSFTDFMSALFNDSETGMRDAVMAGTAQAQTTEEGIERQQAAIELLNDTMKALGKSNDRVNEKVILAMVAA